MSGSLLKDETSASREIAYTGRPRLNVPVEAAAFNPALQKNDGIVSPHGSDALTEVGAVTQQAVRVAQAGRAEDCQKHERYEEPAPVSFHAVEPQAQNSTRSELKKGEQFVKQAASPVPTEPGPLFPEQELTGFRSRWDEVQVSFVDEPRQAVEQADFLVASVVKRIAEEFSAQRQTLEKQWEKGEEVSTEDLRQALKRYRSLFERLLSV